MKIVEQTPRIGVDQFRGCTAGAEFQVAGEVVLLVEVDGIQHKLVVGLTTDVANRWWLTCTRSHCRSRRRRYLYFVEGKLMCRDCAGLKYFEQSWPDSAWRVEVGRPALRAWRRQRKAA